MERKNFEQVMENASKAKHSSAKVFHSALKRFGMAFIGDIFNLYLVIRGFRSATLFEQIPRLKNDDILKYVQWVKEIAPEHGLSTMDQCFDHYPSRLLIYQLDQQSLAEKAIRDCKYMGKILGMTHPLSDRNEWSFNLFLEYDDQANGLTTARPLIPISDIFAESCDKEPDISTVKRMAQRFNNAAKPLGLKVSYEVSHSPNIEAIVQNFGKGNIKFIREHMNDFVNEIWNVDLHHTQTVIEGCTSFQELDFMVKNHHVLWFFWALVCMYTRVNHPHRHMLPCDWEPIEKAMYQWVNERTETIGNKEWIEIAVCIVMQNAPADKKKPISSLCNLMQDVKNHFMSFPPSLTLN